MQTNLVKSLLAALVVASLLLPATQVAFASAAAAATPAATPKATRQPAKPGATATPAPTATSTAVSPAKSSPEQPLAYTADWVTIQPGEWHWYAFKYSYDRNGAQTPAHIQLQANPGNGVTLVLLNGNQVKAWEGGQKLAGFGAATPQYSRTRVREDIGDFCDDYPDDPACTDDTSQQNSKCDNVNDPSSIDKTCNYWDVNSSGYASWTGVIGASGEYYILVRRDANVTGPVQYRFTVSGDGLAMK